MGQGSTGARTDLESFVRTHGRKARADFVRDLGGVPILVQMTEPGRAPPSGFGTVDIKTADLGKTQPQTKPRFGTIDAKKGEVLYAEHGLYVFPLRKSEANAFSAMVTVGRAGNNDIVLPYEGISKFHAYFAQSPQGWTVADAGSTNGTFVLGKQLPPNAPLPLQLKGMRAVEITFSTTISCQLHTTESFWVIVSSLSALMAR